MCRLCIGRVLHAGQPCPHCREPKFTTMLDRAFERLVLNLKVYCDKKNEGCLWSKELRYLQKHLREECLYVVTPCRYCRRDFSRQNLRVHEEEECDSRPLEIKLLHRINVLERQSSEQQDMIVKLLGQVKELEKAQVEKMERHIEEAHAETTSYFEKKIANLNDDLAHQIDMVNSKLTKTEENLKNFVKSTVGSETGNRRKDIDKINKTLEILNHVELKKRMLELEEQFKNLAERLNSFAETEKEFAKAQGTCACMYCCIHFVTL